MASQGSDNWKDAIVRAAQNVPSRHRSKAKHQARGEKKPLESYHNLPDYLRDNEFIVHYYRVDLPFKQTLWSLFGIHNETGNVWTHLLGFVLFLCLTMYVVTLPARGHAQSECAPLPENSSLQELRASGLLAGTQQCMPQQHSHAAQGPQDTLVHRLQEELEHHIGAMVHTIQDDTHHAAQALHSTARSLGSAVQGRWRAARARADELLRLRTSTPLPHRAEVSRWPVYVFTTGAMVCLLMSSACHLFGCCSKHVSQLIWRFDYAGIALLIVTSFVPPVYYLFQCHLHWQYFYLITTSCCGLGAVVVSLVLQRREGRVFRASMFACLGIWGVVPLVHGVLLHWEEEAVRSAIAYDALMGALYLLGALLYAQRLPERLMPGRFDVWLHGHQIFHALIVVAAVAHYKAVMLLLHWRDVTGGCAWQAAAAASSGGLPGLIPQGATEALGLGHAWDSLRHCVAEAQGATAVLEGVPVAW